MLDFGTWLVGVDKHGSFISFYGGFFWEATYDGAETQFSLTGALTAPPADALYQNIIGGFLTASPLPEPAALLLALLGLALFPRRRTIQRRRKK
jgi:MYXO-CTERM domain-containing protein